MLAKSLKFAEDTALPTLRVLSRPAQSHGGTASLKRRQGTIQTAGSSAGSLRLIQPRKRANRGGRLTNVIGKAEFRSTSWQVLQNSIGVFDRGMDREKRIK